MHRQVEATGNFEVFVMIWMKLHPCINNSLCREIIFYQLAKATENNIDIDKFVPYHVAFIDKFNNDVSKNI